MALALRQSGATHLLVRSKWKGTDYLDLAARAIADCGHTVICTAVDRLGPAASHTPTPPVPPPGFEHETGWIFYTSGTTAVPKGVLHSDQSVINAAWGWATRVPLSDRDITSVAFPWAHAGGPMYLASSLLSGASVILIEQFVPSTAVDTLRRFGATMTGGTTAFYQALLAEQRRQPDRPLIPSLRCMTGGAAPMPPELFDEIRSEMAIPVLHSYGASEIMVMASGSVDDSDEQLANTAGRPVDNVSMSIISLEDGRQLPPGEEGQIVVGGPVVCRGYADPALNREAFNSNGDLLTGDLGRIRPDGHLVVTGRIKDIIIRKGENVSALEIEHVLYAHPKVAGAAVIGLPDPERGERVCAVVELSDAADPLSYDEMVAHFEASGLMRQKFPEQLEIVDRLPRGDSLNKVVKTGLRERFAAR